MGLDPRGLVSRLPVGVVTVDPTGTVTFANPRLTEMVGIDSAVGLLLDALLGLPGAFAAIAACSHCRAARVRGTGLGRRLPGRDDRLFRDAPVDSRQATDASGR